jgi:transposase
MDKVLPSPEVDDGAHTTSRKSARTDRVEIITRGARRRWTPEQKRDIVSESFGAELTPTEVARKHDISSGQLYSWRQQLLKVESGLVTGAAARLAKVEVPPTSPVTADPMPVDRPLPATRPVPVQAGGIIEIVLRGGVSVRVDAHVDGDALRRVLAALGRR